MSLASRVLNGDRMAALCVPEEIREVQAVIQSTPHGTVKLRRSFDMGFEGKTIRFWRVVSPEGHPNYQSDLSIDGLKTWGII